MSKARDLADSVSTGGILEDGAVSVSEISDLTVTAAELNNVAGVNSDVQTQLDLKAPLASPTFTGDATFDTDTLAVDSTNDRVGIGTTSPAGKLDISYGAASNEPALLIGADSSSFGLTSRTNNTAKFGTIGAVPYTIADGYYSLFSGNSSSGVNGITIGGGTSGLKGATQIQFATAADTTSTATERMRIDSSGNVGIGTSSPSFESGTGGGLEINNSSGNGAHVKLTDAASGSGGTNGFDLYAFNTSGYIENYETGSIVFRNAGAERMRIAGNGQLGLSGANYGTAGQVLTSGGSGAAPTWADAGGGGAQFDFTADGAINAGDVVALTSAGNAKVPTASSYTAPSDIGFGAGYGSGDRQTDHATCPRTGRKIFVTCYANNLYAIGYTYSGGSFTYGSNTLLRSGSVKTENVAVVATGRADGEFAVFWQNSSNNYIQVRCATVASDRTVSNRSDGEQSVDTTGDQILFQKGIALIGGANQTSPVIACFHDNKGNPSYSGDYFAAITAIQINSSSISVGSTYSNQLSVSGSSSGRTDDFANLVWDSTNSRLIAGWKENGGNCSIRFITNSGTTLTIGSRVAIEPIQANTNKSKFNLVWDDDADHGVIFHYYDTNAPLVARTLYSDGTISSTFTILENGANGSSALIDKAAVLINPNNNQIVYRRIGRFLSENHFCFYVVKVSAGGDIILITSPSGPIIYSESSTSTNYYVYDNRGTLGYHYDDYNDIIMSPFYYRSSSSQPVVSTVSIGTTYDYLGIADNTVTNGQTVTVNLAGSVDENQTGLSAGTTYYTGDNGALATSGDRKVGKALSSTAILITGAND